MLQLFISVLLVVDVLIDAREFTLNTGKVLTHVEHSEVVTYKGEPLVILLVLHADGVITDGLKAVLLNVEQVIACVVQSLLHGLLKVFNEVCEQIYNFINGVAEGCL